MAPKAVKPRQRAKAEAKDLCKEKEGCGLPHAKLWEKAASLLAYLVASRIKKENSMADLVDEAKKAYPACLDQWLNPSGEFLGQATEEKWSMHPDNNKKKKGQVPAAAAAAVVRMYTVQDSKIYRAPSAFEKGGEVLSTLRTYTEFFSKLCVNKDGTLPTDLV